MVTSPPVWFSAADREPPEVAWPVLEALAKRVRRCSAAAARSNRRGLGHSGNTILPWYGAVLDDASVSVTKHVPYFVPSFRRPREAVLDVLEVFPGGASILIRNRLTAT